MLREYCKPDIERLCSHVEPGGSPEMIESMVALLAQQDGLAECTENGPGQIHVDRYWLKGGGLHPDNT